MYEFNIITIFPLFFESFFNESILKKSIKSKLISHKEIDLREYGLGTRKNVDDTPYGGGAGMVYRIEPIIKALEVNNLLNEEKSYKIALSPKGKTFNHEKAKELSLIKKPITLICSRYEGYDERLSNYIDEEISIGDYVLFGGELAAMVLVEAISRLIPGVLGNSESKEHESFSDFLLESPQYTKPQVFEGYCVPEVLTSGDHQKIKNWRLEESLKITEKRRPDLLARYLNKNNR